jgi:hypothetical protein
LRILPLEQLSVQQAEPTGYGGGGSAASRGGATTRRVADFDNPNAVRMTLEPLSGVR